MSKILPFSTFAFLCLSTLHLSADGFILHQSSSSISRITPIKTNVVCSRDNVSLFAKAKKSNKKKKKTSSVSGLKGFGSPTGEEASSINIDRSKESLDFYDFMEKHGADDTLKRVALGYFSYGKEKIRGVVALKAMKKGDVIISIPYELAVNLGAEAGDPTIPAVNLLRKYCETLTKTTSGKIDRSPYYRILPEYMGTDCLGSTDFYSEEALDALQSPLITEETKTRSDNIKTMLEEDPSTLLPKTWIDGESSITEKHLQWATWLITSRVLTVEGGADENVSYRLLIPFLDMCNHDRSSLHVLTGRAVPGGELKVVAGGPIQVGDQINISYGGGMVGNDRFIQDYGFLDNEDGYQMIAEQLIGKKKMAEGANAGRYMSIADRDRTMDNLRQTKMKDDIKLLEETTDASFKLAISYRLGVKKALSKFILVE